MNDNGKNLLSPQRAAELLGVTLQTMLEWIASGDVSWVMTDDGAKLREDEILSPDARSWFQRGCQLSMSPDTVDEAGSCFRKAISLSPQFNLAWFELGRMYYTWGKYYEAEEPLRKTIELNPCFPAFVNYGLSSNLSGQYREAEQAFKQALLIVPEHAEALYQLGFAIMMTSYYDATRMREAIDQFRRALILRPDHALTATFLGESLVIHLSAFEEARCFAKDIDNRLPDVAEHIRRIIQLNEPYQRSASHSKSVAR
jgi:tetratricopeptide (TPR) repeat protein